MSITSSRYAACDPSEYSFHDAGLRKGELLGLKWENLDLETGALQAHRSLSGSRNSRIFETPKGGKGRSIRLSQRAARALREHRRVQLKERMKPGGLWQEHEAVFPSRVGTPLNGRNLTRSFKQHLDLAGLPGTFRFHDLRHTCGPLLLRQGVNPKFAQKSMGHRDVSLTTDVYPHVLPDTGDQAAIAMDATLL